MEDFFFSVESDIGVDRVIGEEDEAAVKAGIPGDMEKVSEVEAMDIAVDEDGGGVEDEVLGFSVLLDEEVV